MQHVGNDGEAVSEARLACFMADTNANCIRRVAGIHCKAAGVADVGALAATLAGEYVSTPAVGEPYPDVEAIGPLRHHVSPDQSKGYTLPCRGDALLLLC